MSRTARFAAICGLIAVATGVAVYVVGGSIQDFTQEAFIRAFNKLLALDTYVTSDQIAQFAKRRVIESGKAMLASGVFPD